MTLSYVFLNFSMTQNLQWINHELRRNDCFLCNVVTFFLEGLGVVYLGDVSGGSIDGAVGVVSAPPNFLSPRQPHIKHMISELNA